jgi:plasmid stabilization system protein ParE
MSKAKKYKLRYLPLFEKDLTAVRDYIAEKLQNPVAAQRLVIAAEKAILRRLSTPLAFEPYQSGHKRKRTYYRIYVKNYTIFYVVIDNVMELRRFLYSGRHIEKLL